MIQLDTGQTLSAKAGTNNVINVTLGPDLMTTTDNFAPTQALIPSSVGTLYTSTGGQTNIATMKIVNTTALDVTGVQFFIIGTNATNNPITSAFTMPASSWAVYADGRLTIYAATTGLPISSNAVVAVTAADGSVTVGGSSQAPTISRAALTGDITASAGSNGTTLATVNSNVGTFGSNTRIPTYTVNGKGLTTASSDAPVLTTPSGQTPVGATRSIATTAPLTGGGDLSADRTFAISAATTSAAGSQSAVDKAKQDNFSAIRVNILDYGGNGNGSFNNDTALANAMAALPSGGIILFPAGQFNHNTVFTASGNNILWQGAGANATVIHFTGTTGDQFTISGYGSGIADMTVQGPGSGTTSSKTGGYGVNLTGTETFAQNIEMSYQFDCIGLNGSLSEIDDVLCRYYGRSAAVVNQNSDHRINRLFTDNAIATLPTGAGIDVQVTASLLISNCNIIHANWCLNVSPGAGVTIPSVKGINNFFDSSAIGLRAAGAGSFFRSEFTNCWFSSMSTAGILFAPTTAGANVDGITFINCDIYNNVAGTTNGVSVTTANVGKWKMIGCSIAGWTNGINLIAGAAHYPTIEGNTIGSVSAFGVNTTGITIGAGAYGGLVIVNNDVNDNTTALSLGAVTITGATYSKYVISSNPGINPRGNTGISAPALGTTATVHTNNTGFRVIAFAKLPATSTTTLTTGAATTAVFLASQMATVTLEPGQTAQWNVVIPASWVWVGQ